MENTDEICLQRGIAKYLNKNAIWEVLSRCKLQVLPLFHFIASFFYSSRRFIHDDTFMERIFRVTLDDSISSFMEHILCVFITRIFAAVLIFASWNLLFYVVKHICTKSWVKIACFTFVVGAGIVLLRLPESFGYEIDNYITYAYTVRYFPYYWHHVFTGCFYGGCLIWFPQQFSIGIVQWALFCITFFFFYNFLQESNRVNKSVIKFSFAVFLVPDVYRIILNPYRNCIYAIVSAFFFFLIFEFLSKKRTAVIKALPVLSVGILVALWRSEGILLGVIGFGAFCLFSAMRRAQKITLFAVFLGLTCIFSLPQRIGNKKYYRSDYSIINTIPSLQLILRYASNLDYAGAEEDLATIDRLFSLDVINQHGLAGYWARNLKVTGNNTQTNLTESEIKAYMKAYHSLVLHNLKSFLKTQISLMTRAIGKPKTFAVPAYTGSDRKIELNFGVMWETGIHDYYTGLVERWKNCVLRQKLNSKINTFCTVYNTHLANFHAVVRLRILLILSLCAISVYEVVVFFLRKDDFSPELLFAPLIWLLELFMIFLFMPDGRTQYLFPFFLNAFFISFYFLSLFEYKLEIKRKYTPVA